MPRRSVSLRPLAFALAAILLVTGRPASGQVPACVDDPMPWDKLPKCAPKPAPERDAPPGHTPAAAAHRTVKANAAGRYNDFEAGDEVEVDWIGDGKSWRPGVVVSSGHYSGCQSYEVSYNMKDGSERRGVAGCGTVRPPTGLARTPVPMARFRTGRYVCQRWMGVNVPAQRAGGVVLNAGGSYERLGLALEGQGRGRYAVRGQLVTFASGPYKGYEAHVGANDAGDTWLALVSPAYAAGERGKSAGQTGYAVSCYR